MKNSNRLKKELALPFLLLGFALASCGSNKQEIADTVVYSKIYTSNENHDFAEAFAIKDGKYIYVGSKDGVKPYIQEGKTKVLDKSSSFIMNGATEGHAHYITGAVMQAKGFTKSVGTIEGVVDFLKETKKNNPSLSLYLTNGWSNLDLKSAKETTDVRSLLDEVESEKPVLMIDNTGHNIFMNSKTIELAGIDETTNPNWSIDGGHLARDTNGRLLGLASDIAMNYVWNKVVKTTTFLTSEDFVDALDNCQKNLHSQGYTSYVDGYASYFGDAAFKGIRDYDNSKGLKLVIEASYKIDPFEDVDANLEIVSNIKKTCTTSRFSPDNVKLFADGECVESLSGWVLTPTPYKNGTTGTQVWQDEAMDDVVRKANAMGLNAHVHTSGDAACKQAVDAMVKAEATAQKGVRNSLAHCFAISEETRTKMAEHGITASVGVTWRVLPDYAINVLTPDFDMDWFLKGYPMKSLLNKGINITCSTDYPANSGGPTDMLGLMQIAVSGTTGPKIYEGYDQVSFSSDEYLSVVEAMDMFTINGARQMGTQETRGSIEVGKYADFLILGKDITTISKSEIYNAGVNEVFFEGESVYTAE